MFKAHSSLEIMDALYVGHARPNAGVQECSVLGNRGALEILTEVPEGIGARIVVVVVPPHEAAQRQDGGRAKQVRPDWRDVECLDLRALVRRTQRIASGRVDDERTRRITTRWRCWRCHWHSHGAGMELLVVGIGVLKPGSSVLKIQMDGIRAGHLKVHSIENVFFIALVVYHHEFWRVEKAPRVQAVRRDEVSPLRSAISEVESSGCS